MTCVAKPEAYPALWTNFLAHPLNREMISVFLALYLMLHITEISHISFHFINKNYEQKYLLTTYFSCLKQDYENKNYDKMSEV